MERDIWTRMMAVLKPFPRTWLPRALYSDIDILCIVLWAVLHDRPISWACRRRNWPLPAWRRRLPNQSTVSRRMRRAEFIELLRDVLPLFHTDFADRDRYLIVDGKPLELSENTRDPDARIGRSVKGFGKGYKLHAMIDSDWNVVAWDVCALNHGESHVAARMLSDAGARCPELITVAHFLLADANYDSNKLYMRAATLGLQLVAPRRKPGTSLSRRKHHRHRLASIEMLEGQGNRDHREAHQALRGEIERFFGMLVNVCCGLSHLPTWTRRLHRCRIWVGAKLVIDAARRSLGVVGA